MINEDFLHFVWKFQLFDFLDLKTEDGKELCVIKPGVHNENSGPDFKSAKISIDGLVWVGHVEIHVNASDWYSHSHHQDGNYDSVILHVVYQNDKSVIDASGEPLFTLSLKDKIPEKYLYEYDSLYHSIQNVPCSKSLAAMDKFFMSSYYEALIVERLEMRSNKIKALLNDCNNDFRECFYRLFAYALGLKINASQMQSLAERCSLKLLTKHTNSRLSVEALLYGQASLLDRNFKDEYPNKLKSEYLFLKEKYKLNAIDNKQWSFFRLRPTSFPTVRISMMADFCIKSNLLFQELFNFSSLKKMKSMLCFNVSDYWKTHYVFDKRVKNRKVTLGTMAIDLILINALLPFSFFYAKQKSNYKMMQDVIDAYGEIKAENNKILRYYVQCGLNAKSAIESQALIHLHQNYCIKRKCLNCRVFNQIIK